jgi:hypothetical protein
VWLRTHTLPLHSADQTYLVQEEPNDGGQRNIQEEVIEERSDELFDEQLDKVSGGTSLFEALAKAWGNTMSKQAETVEKTP